MTIDKRKAILNCFRELQRHSFTLYKSKRRLLSQGYDNYVLRRMDEKQIL